MKRVSPEREALRATKVEGNETESAEQEVPTSATDEHHVKKNGFNLYATKKTVAQGLLDLALLTTNVTQLKHIIIIGDLHPFYHLILAGVSSSLILQVVLGLLLLVLGARDIHRHKVQKLNNSVALLIFIITVLNVFVSIFNDETISRKYRECILRISLAEKENQTLPVPFLNQEA